MSTSTFMTDMYKLGLVSIIIPAYNRRGIILKTIESCFAQTYPAIEVIVCDDGSTDDTCAVIEQAILDHPIWDLHLIRQPNAGPSTARNRGLIASRGEFIQFLDSDDVLVSDKIEKDVTELRSDPEVGVVYGKVVYVNEYGLPMGTLSGTPLYGADFKNVIAKNCWHTIAPLYRREACLRIGPWATDVRGAEDLEYAARLKTSGIPIKFSDRVAAYALADNADKLSHRGDTPSFAQGQELFVDYTWKHAAERNCLNHQVNRDLQMWLMNTAMKYALLKDRIGFERCLGKSVTLNGGRVYLKVRLTILASKLLGCRNTALLIRWMHRLIASVRK